MDVIAVVSAADKFLAELDRPDRVFQFASGSGGGDFGAFIAADPVRFKDVAERLHLPLTTPA
jgi:hypothetical protein